MLRIEEIQSKLRGHLATAVASVEQSKLHGISLSVLGSAGREATENGRTRLIPGIELNSTNASSKLDEPLSVNICSERLSNHEPVGIERINMELVLSGVAIFLGQCSLTTDCAVIGISGRHPWWTMNEPSYTLKDFVKLLHYYVVLARNEFGTGVTFLVDNRDGQVDAMEMMLEAFKKLNVDSPKAFDSIFVLCDAHSLPSLQDKLTPGLGYQVNTLIDASALCKLLDVSQVPSEFGGEGCHDHREWVHYRQLLEPFEQLCCSVTSMLLNVAHGLTRSSVLPNSLEEAREFLGRHERVVESPLTDESFAQLQIDGAKWLQFVSDSAVVGARSSEFRTSRILTKLYPFLLKTFLQISSLAKEMRLTLLTSLKLREFEDSANKVLERLSATKDEFCKEFGGTLAENLPGINLCLQKFCRLEKRAQVDIDTGQDLIKTGFRMLAESGDSGAIKGLADITNALEDSVRDLLEKLRKIREKIVLMQDCYKTLNKSYEWFADATKFLKSLDDKGRLMSPEVVRMSLEDYLRDHPPVAMDRALEHCNTLQENVLLQKCTVAQSNSTETVNLIKLKQNRVNREIIAMHERQFQFRSGANSSVRMRSGAVSGRNVSTIEDLRRRSYAGKSSGPIYGPSRHSLTGLEKDADLQAYVELLFQEGLITNDMSERVVASLPKGLSDSTMRGSRESLRESRESLVASAMSSESLPTSSRLDLTQAEGTATVQRRDLPQWSLLQKARSLWFSGSLVEQSRDVRTGTTGKQNGLQPTFCQSSLNRNQSLPICGQPPGTNGATVSVDTSVSQQQQPLPPQQPASVASSRSSDTISPGERNLVLVMREMVDTERSYINSLKFVISNYVPELGRDDLPVALRGKRNVIFGNLEKIYEFHSNSFLAELEQCVTMPLCVGNVFLRHASEFYMYAAYSKSKPKSDCLMAEHGMLFFRKKQMELGDRMDLSSYLLKPIQRMGKYSLLLEQLLKECDSKDANYNSLKNALEMVRFELRHGNDLLAMDCIRNCDVNLQEQGMLLRQDEFLVSQGSRRCLRRLFLFEDLILFSKTKRSLTTSDQYVYKNSFKTSEIGMTENVAAGDKPQFEIWFRKRATKSTFILQAHSADIRQAWINEIVRILWKQAVKSREKSLNAMQQMGFDWRQNIALRKSSKHKIQPATCSSTSTDPWVWHRAAPSLPNSQLAEQRQVSSAQHRNGVASNHGPRVHSVKSSAEKTGTELSGDSLQNQTPYIRSTKVAGDQSHLESRDSVSPHNAYEHLVSTDV